LALVMTGGMQHNGYLALTCNDLNFIHGTVSVSRTLEWRRADGGFADSERLRSPASSNARVGLYP
jgi:hypothetical protein